MLSGVNVAALFSIEFRCKDHGMPLCGVCAHGVLIIKVNSANRAGDTIGYSRRGKRCMHQLNTLLEVEEFPLLPGLNYRMSGIPKGLVTGGKTAGRSSTQSFMQSRHLEAAIQILRALLRQVGRRAGKSTNVFSLKPLQQAKTFRGNAYRGDAIQQ